MMQREAIYYGAWVSRASNGTFVAELPDFPEVTASGQSIARVVALASVRLSARIASMRLEGRALPPATSAADLLDGCVKRRAVGHFLEVRERPSPHSDGTRAPRLSTQSGAMMTNGQRD
jgi:predicted RNase H-like HicB family nuclease